jgi:hypothetical protein
LRLLTAHIHLLTVGEGYQRSILKAFEFQTSPAKPHRPREGVLPSQPYFMRRDQTYTEDIEEKMDRGYTPEMVPLTDALRLVGIIGFAKGLIDPETVNSRLHQSTNQFCCLLKISIIYQPFA